MSRVFSRTGRAGCGALLILTRKLGESIMIGDQVRVVLVDVKGRQARIGVEAPEEIRIYRAELYERIQEENSRAAQSGTDDLEKVADLWHRFRPEGRENAD